MRVSESKLRAEHLDPLGVRVSEGKVCKEGVRVRESELRSEHLDPYTRTVTHGNTHTRRRLYERVLEDFQRRARRS